MQEAEFRRMQAQQRAEVDRRREIVEQAAPRSPEPPRPDPSRTEPSRPGEDEAQRAAPPDSSNGEPPEDADDAPSHSEGPLSRNWRQVAQGMTSLLAATSSDSNNPEQALRRLIPEGRPEWVEREPYWKGQTQFVSVSSGPFDRPQDCSAALDEEIRRAVEEYIVAQADHPRAVEHVRLDSQFIRDHIHLQTYREQLQASFGAMQQWHGHLQFNSAARDEILRQWTTYRRMNHLVYVGAGFVAVLASLSIFYAALGPAAAEPAGQIGRLRAAAILAILLIGGGAVALYSWIPLI